MAALGITDSSASGNTTNTNVYDYVYNGSSLSYLTVTTTQFGQEPTADTLYFGSGTVTYNGTVYYYVTNLQGDVVAILDADGNPKVQYTYDAWGKILSISGPMADTLGAVNPLTYRGYVYDSETDLYYLESRYYDPAVGRFINGDALISTGQGILGNNIFAYCLNSPCNRVDSSGQCSYIFVIFDYIKLDCHRASCATSECYNPDAPKVVIIYDARFSGFWGYFHDHGFEHQGKELEKRLSSTHDVEAYGYITRDDFISCWNNLDDSYDVIYIVGHGQAGELRFDGNVAIAEEGGEYAYSCLDPVNVNEIQLWVCNGATLKDGAKSIADHLGQITGATVYAVKDGKLGFSWYGCYPELANGGYWVKVKN